jgi:group I intron endonuclease
MFVFPSKKMYVGLTSDLKKRLRAHKNDSKYSKYPVHSAIRKHGWDHVTKTILENCDNCDFKYLNEREKYYIKYYNTYKNGLNCTEGGEGSLGSKKSKKSRALMSQRAKETWKNKSAKEKDAWGERTSKYWKGFSDEKKAMIKQKKRDNWNNLSTEEKAAHAQKARDASKKRAVRAISPEGDVYEFESCREAARSLKNNFGKNFVQCSISQCLNKKLKTHMGFRFEDIIINI